MQRFPHLVAVSLAVVLAVAGVVLARPASPAHADVSAPADIARTADAAFAAWNDAFLVRRGGDVYYADTLTSRGTQPQRMFAGALDIAVAQDVYQRTRSPEHRRLANELVTFFVRNEGTYWDFNSWNDDIAWMTLAMIRGYQTSGNAEWLQIAENNWNMAYDRGWTPPGGGGIWEDNNRYDRGKCALSNNPMITAAMQLHQITGDEDYLTKSRQIYDWVRATLFEPSTGKVNGCVFFPDGLDRPGRVAPSDNAYDSGSFIEAANLLYRRTGDGRYRDDALLAADHIIRTVPIIHQNQGRGTSYQYRFFRGLTEFCTDLGNCDRYRDYILANANAAWNVRDGNDLTWNDWTRPTNAPNPDAFEMASAVAIWQQVPNISGASLSGTYRIQNVASNQYLTVSGGSTAQSAAIVQTADAADPSALWTFVPRSNGHREIRNVRSGQLLNVAARSGASGGAVVQWPFQGDSRAANDQWLPIRNADGTYSLYNRLSQLALDNPGGSATAGAPYHQWAPNDGSPQRFRLIPAS